MNKSKRKIELTQIKLIKNEKTKPPKTLNLTFKEFLSEIRAKAQTPREKGDLFELTIRDFLKKSPEYSFEDVWLWPQWPGLKNYGFSKKDLGVDLVAKEKETGNFWAIQCKCYDENYLVSKNDTDTFLAQSGKKPFSVRLIVTTTNNWGPNALDTLDNQTKGCKILDLHKLEKADFNWCLRGGVKKNPEKKYLRDHQKEAVKNSISYFKKQSRGKLIMACGTGKTFTSLRIVEAITPKNANILFLAPSISLISQTLREYAWQRKTTQRYLAVCSDTKAGKDTDGYNIDDLQISPTTDPQKIAKALKKQSNQRTIVFSTYQSLNKIKEAQDMGVRAFDFVICDEAHRTAGVEAGEEINGKTQGNYFTRINDENYVRAKKRLYMTATPKIYSEKVKNKVKKHNFKPHSMDDEKVFGEEIYRLDFSKAIEKKLLSDYKVVILYINEQYISDNVQEALKETNLSLYDASRLVGCYKALRDQGVNNGVKLKRALGFLNTIKASKEVTKEFEKVVKALEEYQNDGYTLNTKHIDGTDHSIDRNKKLDWLKEDAGETSRGEEIGRVLFNSKCLTEGVDVPSLDAVMFLHPRKSQVDVVQAVGRIMRKQKDKKYGYVILPVVTPADKTPEQALNDNKTYQVVWQVLNALRSHDSRFDAIINQLELNNNKNKIKAIGIGYEKKSETKEVEEVTNPLIKMSLQYSIEEIENKIYAKIVEKCGDRIYEEKWAKEAEQACKTISTRIKSLINKNPVISKEFNTYHEGIKSCINEGVKEEEAISMLSEHIITKPAFDKIFENYKFSETNPISKAMRKVLDRLYGYKLENELKNLKSFYNGISKRLEGIDNSFGRQKVIKEFYENFIKTAFPKTAEKLGVAYTPSEIVDFILKSANEILKSEFNKGLTDKGVDVIDPFVGTGRFINRLIQMTPLIEKKDLPRKFKNELHANEIMLLPYYIASVNIEEAYHSRMCVGVEGNYTPFSGIALTDTFNIEEEKNNASSSDFSKENEERIERQKNTDIQVIVGNPPYSVGQKNENDANKNQVYPKLHQRIKDTYVKESNAILTSKLYDSYIKAIRWATDRIGDKGGVIGFVHNASIINERSTAGVRKMLAKEFDSIYCFNLRGNQRTKGEVSKKEGGKIFGGNCRTPVAITFLVKNPNKKNKLAKIKYHDIGDYLKREKKLDRIKNFGSIKGLEKQKGWEIITPDKHGDWLNQRDDSFYNFIPMVDKKNKTKAGIFDLYSCGVVTSRDAWAYNFSKNKLKNNMQNMINVYNQELKRLKNQNLSIKNMDKFINLDNKKIKWSSALKSYFIRNKKGIFNPECIRKSSYRPFTKSWLYFDNMFNDRVSQNPKLFPTGNIKNKVICVSGVGAKEFSVLMVDSIPDFGFLDKTQCFPLYRFTNENKKYDSITNNALKMFNKHYKKINITKEDIFYYTYGLLHSKDYRTKYKSSLDKTLPRIPLVGDLQDFKAFTTIGRKLAKLHLNYEDQPRLNEIKILKNEQKINFLKQLKPEDLTVQKMKVDKKDKTKIIFNDHITITNIPPTVWEYKVNGWSPIKWVMERYRYKKDKETDLVNDPNSYSEDPSYILKLLLSVMSVSLKTTQLIDSLPPIEKDSSSYKKRA